MVREREKGVYKRKRKREREREREREEKKERVKGICLQHLVFPGGHPSKY